jgi:hypothetical protein
MADYSCSAHVPALDEGHRWIGRALQRRFVVVGLRRTLTRIRRSRQASTVELCQAARGNKRARVQLEPTAANDFMHAAFGHLSDRAVTKHEMAWAIRVPARLSSASPLTCRRGAKSRPISLRDRAGASVGFALLPESAGSLSDRIRGRRESDMVKAQLGSRFA